jgi:hypothetical protein
MTAIKSDAQQKPKITEIPLTVSEFFAMLGRLKSCTAEDRAMFLKEVQKCSL